ncbi:MAG TPA: hypothetical protein VIM48_09835 [Chthoniobacterales bacterium]
MSSSDDSPKNNLLQEGWHFVACMPQLQLKEAIDLDHMAIVPPTDARLSPFREHAPVISRMLDGFTNNRGQKAEVASLLAKDDVPEAMKSKHSEAVGDYRNAYAIACISNGWQQTVGGPNAVGTLFSDYFDFYPAIPVFHGDGFVVRSASIDKYDRASKFFGHLYPDLPETKHLTLPQPDRAFLKLLLFVLDQKYRRKRVPWPVTALSRSLAYAFRAGRMPKGCDNFLFDYGINLGLWHAAFDCLVKPRDPNLSTNKQFVFDLLEKRDWYESTLKRKVNVKVGKNRFIKLNYIQRLYNAIRIARNDFLHGNRVNLASIADRRTIKSGSLLSVAPLVYQVAVEQFISENFSLPQVKPSKSTSIANYIAKNRMSTALLAFLNGPESSDEDEP